MNRDSMIDKAILFAFLVFCLFVPVYISFFYRLWVGMT